MPNYETERVEIGAHSYSVTTYDDGRFVTLSTGETGEHGLPGIVIYMDTDAAARLGNALIEASIKYRIEPVEPLADPELPF